MYRTFRGDRFHHLHSRSIEDASLTTISDLLNRTTGAADLPLSAFAAAGVEVCGADCTAIREEDAELSDSYKMAWEIQEDEELISLSLSAKGVGDRGMLGVGFGGLTMSDAQDFVICELFSTDEAECIDRQPTSGRSLPPRDDEDAVLKGVIVEMNGEWTTVTFLKPTAALDDQDYDLAQDIEDEKKTKVIYSFGESLGQHPTSSRGASKINFATGDTEIECDENNFVSLHGALMLIAWMILAPWGIYYVRQGEEIDFIWRYEWWEMHEEIMIVASEAVLPLGITAIFASGSQHGTEHAHWGYYMIVAVMAQVLSGWLRVKGLGGKNANFSVFHRFNKFFHIYAGRFAYLAGVVQCYRGLELVASDDKLIFSAGDGLNLELGSFGFVYEKVFPAWLGLIALVFVCLETRKQYRRYFKKGSAKILGCVEIINERHDGEGDADENGAPQYQRLVPRTEDLPIYSLSEFNEKVLNGQSWLLVDGAILDLSEFAARHPGGRRLILNALGTDVTAELLGEDMSVGHAMSFSPHVHSERAWTILKGLVIGYIDEDDEQEEDDGSENVDGGKPSSAGLKAAEKKFTIAGQSAVFIGTRRSIRSVLTGDAMSAKAKRLNGLATISTGMVDVADAPGGTAPQEMGAPLRRVLPKRSTSDSGRSLERFHVCPLLFRERMGAVSSFGRGYLPTSRPVYRYIFLCPGQAQILAQSITGVCYFNMRAQEKGHGVVQRSYNAYAVRVQDTSGSLTPGAMMGGLSQGSDKGSGTLKVVPAGETKAGVLCIEMRIRLYTDGAMSKLLENLAKDTDNPSVQLQGPFVIQKLVPRPAHRNVVMIAAGTGINPMVQQIRDYLALPKSGAQSSRSRLALVWQATSEADLFGADEIAAMQDKSDGLLEVVMLISGEHRKRNIPGAAFRKGAETFLKKAGLISPTLSSPGNSIRHWTPGRPSREFSMGTISEVKPGVFPEESEPEERAKNQKGGYIFYFCRCTYFRSCQRMSSTVVRALTRGKVSREVLDEVFGPSLLGIVEAARTKDEDSSTMNRRRPRVAGRTTNTFGAAEGGGDLEEKEREEKDDYHDDRDLAADLAGSDTTPGRLQVVVSGPTGFVSLVETILGEMGIPSSAIVLLD
ncbi:unnamed protein product [Ectocarpus sp. 12 AP-2014]